MGKRSLHLTTFEEFLEMHYGKRGTKVREEYEQGFETFKLGVMLQEFRKEKGMTQEQLAVKCGTTRTYISRIENNVGDIRLSTLIRMISEGWGGRLRIRIEL